MPTPSLPQTCPQLVPIPRSFKHKAQQKALERQARHLQLLNKATLLDHHISWAEDERSSLAKANTTSKYWWAINADHNINLAKTKMSIKQQGRNTGYALSSTIKTGL